MIHNLEETMKVHLTTGQRNVHIAPRNTHVLKELIHILTAIALVYTTSKIRSEEGQE